MRLWEKGSDMGQRASEALDIRFKDLPIYLHANHSAYMRALGRFYYLTDVNDGYWRVQDTAVKNEKGHFVDCSELVPTISELLSIPFAAGHTIEQLFDGLTFYASERACEGA